MLCTTYEDLHVPSWDFSGVMELWDFLHYAASDSLNIHKTWTVLTSKLQPLLITTV